MRRGYKLLLLTFGPIGVVILLFAAGAPDAGAFFGIPAVTSLLLGLVALLISGSSAFAPPKSATAPSSPPPPPETRDNGTASGHDQKERRHAPPPPKTEPKTHRQPHPEPESPEVAHSRVLGLTGQVTIADIKRRYRERIKEYHPDKVAALGPKLQEVADQETKKINAAYEFFSAKYGSNRNA